MGEKHQVTDAVGDSNVIEVYSKCCTEGDGTKEKSPRQ